MKPHSTDTHLIQAPAYNGRFCLSRQKANICSLKAETHDATNRCDTSPQQDAATNRLVWHVKILVAATEFCRCDLSHEFKLIWICGTYRSDKISASSLVAPCVRICDKSLRQNLNQPTRKHKLVSRHVIFEVVYISSLPKLITCTEQVSYRSDLLQDQCRRGDLSPRCVAAICRIVCLGLKINQLFSDDGQFFVSWVINSRMLSTHFTDTGYLHTSAPSSLF